MNYTKPLLAVAILIIASENLYAHSGGLNANGCHSGSRPYHCHRSQSEVVTSNSGRTRLRCNLGSQSADCINPRNPPKEKPRVQRKQSNSSTSSIPKNSNNGRANIIPVLTTGFSNAILELQVMLIRHCKYLPINLIDGYPTKATKKAIEVFQRSHGVIPNNPNADQLTAQLLRDNVTGNCKPSHSESTYVENINPDKEISLSQKRITDGQLTQQSITTKFDSILVRNLQSHLSRLGFEPGPIDGLHGPTTSSAIIRYQHSRELPIDGVPTYRLLFRLTRDK